MNVKTIKKILLKESRTNDDEKIFSIQDLLSLAQDKEFLTFALKNFSKKEIKKMK